MSSFFPVHGVICLSRDHSCPSSMIVQGMQHPRIFGWGHIGRGRTNIAPSAGVGKERDHARGEGADLQAGRHQGSHQRGAGRSQGVQEPDGSGTASFLLSTG